MAPNFLPQPKVKEWMMILQANGSPLPPSPQNYFWFSLQCRNFILILFHLFIFTLVTFDFGVKSKKSLPRLISKTVCLLVGLLWLQIFPSSSFWVNFCKIVFFFCKLKNLLFLSGGLWIEKEGHFYWSRNQFLDWCNHYYDFFQK